MIEYDAEFAKALKAKAEKLKALAGLREGHIFNTRDFASRGDYHRADIGVKLTGKVDTEIKMLKKGSIEMWTDSFKEELSKIGKKLTPEARKHISKKNFAEPGRKAYPIEDKAHARNALARVAQHGTPAEKAQVRAKVHAKYPDIGKEKKAEVIMAKLAKKHMPHFTDQHRDPEAKKVYKALEREHPEYSAGKKARIAESTANKVEKKAAMEKHGKDCPCAKCKAMYKKAGVVDMVMKSFIPGVRNFLENKAWDAGSKLMGKM